MCKTYSFLGVLLTEIKYSRVFTVIRDRVDLPAGLVLPAPDHDFIFTGARPTLIMKLEPVLSDLRSVS